MSPGTPDPAVVRRHLAALDAALQHLRRHQGKDLATIVADHDALLAVERGLHLCAQNALDIATHLAAAAGHDAPDYAASIDALGEIGAVPNEFVARFRGIAGFRNVIVHAYLDIDLELVHTLLNERLDDFIEFASFIPKVPRRRQRNRLSAPLLEPLRLTRRLLATPPADRRTRCRKPRLDPRVRPPSHGSRSAEAGPDDPKFRLSAVAREICGGSTARLALFAMQT